MRTITSFFKRPSFAATSRDARAETQADDPAPAPESSPLTELSSSLHSNDSSPQRPKGQRSQLNAPLSSQPIGDTTGNQELQHSFFSTDDPSPGTSFSSHRVVKKGKEVVISSDGEDTDSISSLEAPEDIFTKFIKPGASASKRSTDSDSPGPGMNLRGRGSTRSRGSIRLSQTLPKYRHTLDSLVVKTVDDNETEASIAKLKAAFEKEALREAEKKNALAHGSNLKSTRLHEGVLASALGDDDDELGLQRLLDAVRRTEALDLEKTWHFFDNESELPPALDFPTTSIKPGTQLFGLRETHSRERAFHSGIVDVALARSMLPDALISWVFHSVPSESQDSIRQAYCRAVKNTPAERIKTLITPADIDQIFHRLGATPRALSISEEVIPDAEVTKSRVETGSPREGALLAVLDLLSGAADSFAENTRERVLNYLFRLTLDASLTSNARICSELEQAILSVLGNVHEDTVDDLVHRVCMSAYDTIKDATLQSRLLKHILPVSDWIAVVRCRLALSFLTHSPLPLSDSLEKVFNLKRITSILKGQRFEVKRYKRKGENNYDYEELGSITALLNIVIDSGRFEATFPDKAAEREFNADVDALSDRLKKIFTSIEDSGASHLKRTLTKEALESLHYRVIYSVRTKPRPKQSIYGEIIPRKEKKEVFSGWKTKPKQDQDTEMPIRQHDQ
ncbi:hypothetical protein BO70DRAFT_290805 [Aspergillus heteromorphus CBS 117.55]|uniref:Uncharacterized protein n=1 Tax=Aspergillus heteromorphus CBS 117.55 TaxID=1448321 RepID=A0A317WDZ8_9EURO|nr:uncharacterized protein BO70DRAFT_290805 [Aspergillus heteromorphus CBS 117.55]PWY83527.1 hypothetical protein BO70DRAFT_290805 [Aspergillus heteromorphus CBS 117.55]